MVKKSALKNGEKFKVKNGKDIKLKIIFCKAYLGNLYDFLK